MGDANIAERDGAFGKRGANAHERDGDRVDVEGDHGIVAADHAMVALDPLAPRVRDRPHEEDQTGLVIADQKEERAVYANAR